MARDRLYQKLPGLGRSFLSVVTYRLYLGPDHLLKVESTRVTEKYRRFYFTDIQGFSIQKTRRGTFLSLFYLLSAVALAVGAYAARDVRAAAVPMGVIAAAFGVLGLVTLLFGPTSRTRLFTAVSNEEIPSLNRLRRARAVLRRLTPLVEDAQGGAFDPAQYVAGTEPFESALPPAGHPGLIVSIFFAAILLNALALGLDLFIDHAALTFAIIVLMMAAIVLGVVSLIQGYQRRLRRGLLVSIWMGGVFSALALLLHYGLALYVEMQNLGSVGGSNFESLRKLSAISAQEHTWLWLLLLSLGAFGVFTGALGFFFTRPPAGFEQRKAS